MRRRKIGFFTLCNYSREINKVFIGFLGWPIVLSLPEGGWGSFRTKMRTVTKDQNKSYSGTNTTICWIYFLSEPRGVWKQDITASGGGDSLRGAKADLTIGRDYEGIPEWAQTQRGRRGEARAWAWKQTSLAAQFNYSQVHCPLLKEHAQNPPLGPWNLYPTQPGSINQLVLGNW